MIITSVSVNIIFPVHCSSLVWLTVVVIELSHVFEMLRLVALFPVYIEHVYEACTFEEAYVNDMLCGFAKSLALEVFTHNVAVF